MVSDVSGVETAYSFFVIVVARKMRVEVGLRRERKREGEKGEGEVCLVRAEEEPSLREPYFPY